MTSYVCDVMSIRCTNVKVFEGQVFNLESDLCLDNGDIRFRGEAGKKLVIFDWFCGPLHLTSMLLTCFMAAR